MFILAAANLNRLAFFLSFPVLALVLGYSYSKRYMWGTHFWLGASLGCAPLGAWIAVRGEFQAEPVLLGLAVLCWTTGFDIIYAPEVVYSNTKWVTLHCVSLIRFRIGILDEPTRGQVSYIP